MDTYFPGGNGTPQEVTIENSGSSSFSNGIYVEVDSYTNFTNNPTAGDDSTKYMSGSFLVVANSTHWSADNFWFVNQITWNDSTYESPASPTSGAVSWGWYHNASQRWRWELKNTTNAALKGCNNNEATGLKVQGTEDSNTLSGATSATYEANSSEWSVWTIDSGPLKDYCIAAFWDCQRLMLYKHDMNSSLPACTNRTYLSPGTLSPGVNKVFNFKPHIPNGVPAGSALNSTVTFTAA